MSGVPPDTTEATSTPTTPPARSRRHRVVAGVVALVVVPVAVVVLIAVNRGDDEPGREARSASPSASVPSSCRPRVVESGYTTRSVRDGTAVLSFGAVVQNPCPQAVIAPAYKVTVTDTAGRPVPGSGFENPWLPVLRPGQRQAVAGEITLSRTVPAGSVRLVFTQQNVAFAPDSMFSAWPRSVSADVTVGPVKPFGFRTVSWVLHSSPAGTYPCNPVVIVLVRDAAGRLLFGEEERDVDGGSRDILFPANADPDRTEVSVAQGDTTLDLKPVPAVACR